MLRRQGVLSGVPDLAIMEPAGNYHGLFVELKAGKNDLTDNQEFVCRELANRNYRVELCKSIDEFKGTVERYFENELTNNNQTI